MNLEVTSQKCVYIWYIFRGW